MTPRNQLLTRRTAAVLALLGLMQLLPYGRDHTNPPVVKEPKWSSTATRELAVRACFDCHSNETRWPWYASVAPASWLVQRDVNVGRRTLNFSEWQRSYEEAHEAPKAVREGQMPLAFYVPLHPRAALSRKERIALAQGLAATLGNAGESHRGESDHDAD